MERCEPARYQKLFARACGRLVLSAPLIALWLSACASVDARQQAVAAPAQPAAQQQKQARSIPEAATRVAPLVLAPTLPTIIAAREAMTRRQWSALDALVSGSQDDILSGYPQYWALRAQLWNTPSAAWPVARFEQFIAQQRGAYLADRFKGDWVLAAARNGDYERARRLTVEVPNDHVRCAQLEARYVTGSRVTGQDAVAAFKPVNACWTLFDRLVPANVVQWGDLQFFLRDAVEQNKPEEAQRFAGYMFGPAMRQTFQTLYKDPMRWVAAQPRPPRDAVSREMVAVALARLARTDREMGDQYIRREWAGQLPPEDEAWVRSQFAIIAALNLDPRAHQWYREAGHVPMTEYSQAWKVRSALRQPTIDWKWVMASIDYMPPSQQEETVWVYWRGRALQALGENTAGLKTFGRIEDAHDFYGQLAREELGQTLFVPPAPSALTQREVAAAHENPGLQRAIALFRLNWRSEAVPEWNFALRDMNDRELLAAAELARAENLYDRVVNTSERTKKEFDFTQRYIAPFEGRVSAQARSIGLDPAWVYGLIRQESRFVMNAKSSVGASGLMQLMPATARFVAKKIGMANFTPASVNDFDTNTILGTNYLNMVLQDLGGSEVLATAGYNAGPRRPHTWRGSLPGPVEGAIFAETIPFTETRLYVKHVMANATYYSALFTGQPQSLKRRLGVIAPQSNEDTSLP